jgi:amidase
MNEAPANDHVHPLAPGYGDDPILSLSALEQGARIADGTLRSRDLVELYLSRIARHDMALHACASVMEDAARREAERADRLRAQGRLLGPFHGVPTAVKDHHFVRFTRTRIGSRAFDWLWTPTDDDFVRTLRAAGFVILAKTAMSELGILPVCETALHPPTRNPWNTARTAGGSSGGAGAAIAAGLVPIAPGSDGAGSVRIPSALNGLVGLKPTRGLVPDVAGRINVFGLSTDGPMARSLDDAAALLDVLCRPARAGHLRRARDPVGPLKIGLYLDPPIGEADPRILALVEQAAERLREAGHTVERRTTPSRGLDEFTPVYQRFVSKIPVPFPSRLGPFARWFWESGHKVSEADAHEKMRRFQDDVREATRGVDVLLSPTVGVVPFKVGQFAALDPPAQFRSLAPLGAFTAIANISGRPALTVPFGAVDGMPVGVQLSGALDTDAQLFSLARALQ